MAQHPCVSVRRSFLLVFACLCCAATTNAVPVVWTGLSTTFSKVGTDDPTLPASQDRLTDNVWLTRASSEGMFNIAPGHETSYVRFTSPADTKWATDVVGGPNVGKNISASNWPDLIFTNDWAPAYGGPGSALGNNITTHNAVVHLVTDDIYLNLLFTQFTSGGDFAYRRSTPATGDYNGNQVVDAADYVAWRKALTQSATFFNSPDGNANGTIDSGDYTFWRQHFGNNVAGSAAGGSLEHSTVVPEPATITLLLMGLLFFQRRRSLLAAAGWCLRQRRAA